MVLNIVKNTEDTAPAMIGITSFHIPGLLIAETAGKILKELGYGKHKIELARIAGYMHDIGNSINRHDHAHSGAILAYQILKETDMPLKDILGVRSAGRLL